MRIEFVVAGGYAAKRLEAAEQPFSGVALGVACGIVGPALVPGRNDDTGPTGGQGGHQEGEIVAPVGKQVGPHLGRVDQQRVQVGLGLRGFEYALPDARGRPPLEAGVRRMPIAPFLGQGPSPGPVARQPQHGFYKLAVVASASPARPGSNGANRAHCASVSIVSITQATTYC